MAALVSRPSSFPSASLCWPMDCANTSGSPTRQTTNVRTMTFFLSRVSISVWPPSYTRRRMSSQMAWSIGQGSFQCSPAPVSARSGRPKRVTRTACPSRTTNAVAWNAMASSACAPDDSRAASAAISLHQPQLASVALDASVQHREVSSRRDRSRASPGAAGSGTPAARRDTRTRACGSSRLRQPPCPAPRLPPRGLHWTARPRRPRRPGRSGCGRPGPRRPQWSCPARPRRPPDSRGPRARAGASRPP